MNVFMSLSVIGLVLSVVVHLSALVGASNPLGKLVWGLHLGIFVAFVPAIMAAKRMSHGVEQSQTWKTILRGCPSWMTGMTRGLFGYSFVNFFLATASEGEADTLRAFSGHWMLFYSASFVMLYSATRPGAHKQVRCPLGHEVSPGSKQCEICGNPVNPDIR